MTLRSTAVLLTGLLLTGCDSEPTPPVAPPGPGDVITEPSPFTDAGLDAGVRLQLRLGSDVDMPTAALDSLKVLVASEFGVENLIGIDRLAALETLDISVNQIQDLTPLARLRQLQRLDASSNQIEDVRPLGQLSQLRILYLDHNQIGDVSPLVSVDSLARIDLTGNPVRTEGLQALSGRGVLVRYGAHEIEPDPCNSPTVERSGTFVAETNGALFTFRSGTRCLRIDGSLTLEGPIDDLSPLSTLTEVDGTLRIRRTEAITDLAFLPLLTRVAGDLAVTNNERLITIEGLARLRAVEDRFIVRANPVLSDLGSLDRLVGVDELRIESNPQLMDIGGLESLGNVYGNFVVSANDSLADLEGLRNLEEVAGSLNLDSNDRIQHVQGLRGLRRVGGSLRIRLNDRLTSLAGLDPEEIGGAIDISNNGNLSQNAVDAFVSRMQSKGFTGSVRTGGNGP